MDMDEHYAPFPGARATPTKLSGHDADVQEPSRLATVPGLAYQNAAAQKAGVAGPPAVQPMPGRPRLAAPAPVSVVLMPSPIKVHEYSEYEVAVTGK